ncbi:hypothetical protein Anas_07151 [Armadillidium nasatum]|uniref:Uncharacterized protein n=1 Tax=Armadillidium nasatum TaxID=96803 RepID=A0A5N5SUE9_9CRUS|nr:hypothetical protein Anas_07151 [Armadillidium nasatum]
MGCCRCCCIILLTSVIIIGFSLGFFAGFFPYPTHASCKVTWQFGRPCKQVKDALINQIKEWSSNSCSSKQQCGYEYYGEDGNTIRGKRRTPVLKFVDSFNFTFESNGIGCKVEGVSASDAWYAVVDFGYNYCNLKNLVIGSRLDERDPAYEEESSNSICTMYSIAHCNLYSE